MLLTVAQVIKDLLPLCLRVQNIFAVGQPDRSLQYVQFCLEQSECYPRNCVCPRVGCELALVLSWPRGEGCNGCGC